jgi:hypothetical protein
MAIERKGPGRRIRGEELMAIERKVSVEAADKHGMTLEELAAFVNEAYGQCVPGGTVVKATSTWRQSIKKLEVSAGPGQKAFLDLKALPEAPPPLPPAVPQDSEAGVDDFEERFVEQLNSTRDFWVETQETDGLDTLRLSVSDKVTGLWRTVSVELDTEPVE